MATITIFTPAYNRAHTIGRTYESLCRQTCKDFEWLVVDDGSKDNTRELVEGWITKGLIPIRYIYQENQGMHGAHNTAYRNITTELNVCIDSDDYMPDDAVEKIVTFWKEHGSEKYAGIIGLDQAMGGDIIGTRFAKDLNETTLMGFYDAGGTGDKKLVYRTSVINQYPEYPIFEGERYVGLAYKYHLVDQDYPLLVLNEVLCIVEYQMDGSSMNMYRQYWNNPKGWTFYRKEEMKVTKGWKRKMMVNIHYVSSSIMAHNRHFIKESPNKAMTIISLPFGIALYYLIKYKVKKHRLLKVNA